MDEDLGFWNGISYSVQNLHKHVKYIKLKCCCLFTQIVMFMTIYNGNNSINDSIKLEKAKQEHFHLWS